MSAEHHGGSSAVGDLIRVAACGVVSSDPERLRSLIETPGTSPRRAAPADAGRSVATTSRPPTRPPLGDAERSQLEPEPPPIDDPTTQTASRSGGRSRLARPAPNRVERIVAASSGLVAVAAIAVTQAGLVSVAPPWLAVALAVLTICTLLALLGPSSRRQRRRVPKTIVPTNTRRYEREGGAPAPPSIPLADDGESPTTPWIPLVDHRRHRAVAGATIGGQAAAELDIAQLVDDVAQGRTVETLPKSTRTVAYRTVAVLIDHSPAIEPVRHDIESLVAELKLVGGHGLAVHRFDGDPTRLRVAPRSRHHERHREVTAVLGDTPTRVIVVTDLGVGIARTGPLPKGHRTWLAFDRRLRARGHSPLYVVPYPRLRWHSALQTSLNAVVWSDDLSVRDITAATGQ